MVTYDKADIKVITIPVTVMYICPFCGNYHSFGYDPFEEKYGQESDWKYIKLKCENCGKMFDVGDIEREDD